MSDQKRALHDALRTHLDLDEPPDEVFQAWRAAAEEDKEELLDRLLLEALLVDTLGRRGAGSGRARARRRSGLRPTRFAAAAVLLVAIGGGVLLWRALLSYPRPRAAGDFSLRSVTGERVPRTTPRRGDRIIAGPGGAQLSLGGYCELALGPDTAVVLRGEPGKEVIELEEGKIVSRITPDNGEFMVLTPRGPLVVVGTEFETTVAYPAPKGGSVMKRSRKSAIVTVLVVSGLVAYHFGEWAGELSGGMSMVFAGEGEGGARKIVAGKPTYRSKGSHPSWREQGRIVGLVRQSPGGKLEALDADGKVVSSFSVKPGGKIYELQWLRPGTYALRVSADGYETLVVKNLVVKARNDLHLNVEFEEGTQAKTIEAGKPTRSSKDHPMWQEKGRIVGLLRGCPGCKVDALDGKGNVVKSSSVEPGARAYELGMLTPGTYTLRVAADGYETLLLKDLAVKAKSDLRINLEF